MHSDLFDQLGGGGGGRNATSAATTSSTTTTAPGAPLVSIKAGKMNLEWNGHGGGSYRCTADPARGELRLLVEHDQLLLCWYNRREQTVVDRYPVIDASSSSSSGTSTSLSMLEAGVTTGKDDRVYVWNHGSSDSTSEYRMFWMQDVDATNEEEQIAQINQYLADPSSAIAARSSTAAAGAANAPSTTTTTATTTTPQVDALSSILENLGMPQSVSSSGDSTTAGAAAATTTRGDATGTAGARGTGGGTLTLADLQGAMANIGTTAPAAAPAAPNNVVSLANVVTPAAITSLLQDEALHQRLLELLPPEQQSIEHLEDNLRSPQVQQTLRALTMALMADDAGNMDGFYSILANFQLDPSDGTDALAAHNPVQAFLDCILKKVEKEKEEEAKNDEDE